MKKSLVLAMAMALGVTASAYAANPFSDVPAGHWAYDAVDKLAAAGVVDGMGDGTYQGDKTMTRYEMAQITAKAMAKGANVDKLAAEFADELDNLGVRVAKLEKKASNVTITGQIRYEYADRSGDYVGTATSSSTKAKVQALNRLRTRLFLKGAINENWTYNARLQNDQKFDAANNNSFDMNQAYLTGRVGGLKVVAGKAPQFLGNGNIYDDTMTFMEASYGKKINVAVFAGQDSEAKINKATHQTELWGVKASTKVGVVSLAADYTEVEHAKSMTYTEGASDLRIASATVKMPVAKNTGINATYLKSNANTGDNNGWVAGVSYKGANAKKVGSWGAWASYYDQGRGTVLAHTMKTGDWAGVNKDGYAQGVQDNEGFKGYGVGATYTVAKNMVYMLDYYDLEGKQSEKDSKVLWSRLQMSF